MPMIEFSYNNSYHRNIGMTPFEALYVRRCRTSLFWDEVGEIRVEGPELIQQIIDKVELIKKRIKIAQDRQASYANTKRIPLHFEIGENVFLRFSPFRRVIRFGLKAFTTCFMCHYFVSTLQMSRKFFPKEVHLELNLSYVERSLRIIDRKYKVLRNKRIPLVMVQWKRRGVEEELGSWIVIVLSS
ncbi:uncharacterized protein [Henckelia pumila]|uniref:uncharacterized protein n=1 Tax=Henckelia pumila TaxID=405737 RepID=UPI003C6E8069